MKILYHSRTFATGGGRIHIDEIVKNLKQLEHNVKLVEPISGGRKGKASSLSKLKSKLPAFISEILELLYNFKDYKDLSKNKHYDFIYERHALYNLAGMWYAKKNNIPFILEVNSPLTYERSKFGNLFFKKIAKKLELKVFKSATKIFCVSEQLKKILIGYGVDKDKITSMHNGIDKNITIKKKSELIEKLNLKNKKIIGFVGYLLKWHGGKTMVSALKKLFNEDKDIVFLLIGGVDYNLKLNGIEKEKFVILKDISHDKIYDYINLFDIGILADCNEYCSSMKVIEYMGLEKSVVVPKRKAIEEIVKNNETGLVITPNNSEKLYSAIKQLLKNEKLRIKLGKNARKFILKNKMTWQDNAKNIINSVKL